MESRPDSLWTIVDDSISEKEGTAKKKLVCQHGLFYLRFVGLIAEDGKEPSRFSTLRGYFGALIAVAIFGFQFTLLTEETNGEIIAKFIAEFLAAKTVICKVLPIILNRKNILDIWQKLHFINLTWRKSLMEQKISDSWDSLQYKMIKLLARSYIAAVIINLIITWFDCREFPIRGAFPDWAKISPWFYLVYTVTAAMLAMRAIIVSACDFCSIIAMCRLFSELQRVQHLISELEENNREALRRVLMRHIVVLDLGRMICDNFSLVFILQHFNMSMSICLLGAVAIYTSEITLLINLILFMVFYVSQLAVICYVGEKLMQESLKIANCIDNSYDKFLNDVHSLKLMSIMLMTAQKPLKFSFGSTNLSLSFYSQTLNTIYSFFMILKSLVK